MDQRVWRGQNDDRAGRSAYASLRHHRARQRQLALQALWMSASTTLQSTFRDEVREMLSCIRVEVGLDRSAFREDHFMRSKLNLEKPPRRGAKLRNQSCSPFV